MRRKRLAIAVAVVGLALVPVFAGAAYARTGLVVQSALGLAPGVDLLTMVDSQPRNVINVTRISPAARIVIKAVAASPIGQGATATVAALCHSVNGVACINGDFFDFRGNPLGGELVNGVWLRRPGTLQQQLYLDGANRFSLGAEPQHATQSLGATSYAILRPGEPIAIPEHDAFADGSYARTLVGWNAAGDRLLVTVEKGWGSAGMSLAQAAALTQRLGATTAVNEDGGGSSQMVAGGARRAAPGQVVRPVANIWAVTA